MTFLPLLLSVLALDPAAATPSAAWRFVAPPLGDPFEHPPWRAISLSADEARGRHRESDLSRPAGYWRASLRQPRLHASHGRG